MPPELGSQIKSMHAYRLFHGYLLFDGKDTALFRRTFGVLFILIWRIIYKTFYLRYIREDKEDLYSWAEITGHQL